MKINILLGDYYMTHDAIERDPKVLTERFAKIMREALAGVKIETLEVEPPLHVLRSVHR